jgi:hypothetical protein
MRKVLFKSLSVFMAFTFLLAQNFSAYATESVSTFDESDFSYDEAMLLAELEELDALDAFVEVNEGITFSDLETSENLLVANMENAAAPMGMAGQGDDGPPLGIPSFLWGCVLGVVGMLIVYIMTDSDKAETKKALWGCVASTAVSVVLYMVIWGAWAATATSVAATGYY